MAGKKNSYINTELDWAEQQLSTWRAYVDDNPIEKLKDRMEFKQTRTGGVIPMVVATKEQQIKCIQDTMERYLRLLEVVNNLREKEDQKIRQIRGNDILNPFESGDI